MKVKTKVVRPGGKLPCPQSKIIHTEKVERSRKEQILRVWYVEPEESKRADLEWG